MMTSSICRDTSAIQLHITGAGQGQYSIVGAVSFPADAVEAARFIYERIIQIMIERRIEIVHERIFGSLSVEFAVQSVRKDVFRQHAISNDTPVTYIQGNPSWGEGLAGVIIRAVSNNNSRENIWTIMDGGMPCGRGWKQNGVTHLVLQNIQALGGEELTPPILPLSKGRSEEGLSSHPLSRPAQARLMLERAERILRKNGASYKDVVRTWFYLSDILAWYAAFNKVRNEKYGEFGIMPGPGDRELLLPASTGIQGETPSGAACAMDLIAVLNNGSCTRKLSNPSQLDAFRYGSAFARASIVRNGGTDLIEVSGTAAIDEHGVSLYTGDIRAQIECTLEKVQALLEQEGAGLEDICSATVFVKQPEFAGIFYEMAVARGLENFPCVYIVADVCREELLFEIDAEAVVTKGGE